MTGAVHVVRCSAVPYHLHPSLHRSRRGAGFASWSIEVGVLLVALGILAELAGKRSSAMGGTVFTMEPFTVARNVCSVIDRPGYCTALDCTAARGIQGCQRCVVMLYCFRLAPRIFSATTSFLPCQCVSIASQATAIQSVCALSGLPREKKFVFSSVCPKPKSSQHAAAHYTCGYCPRFASHRAKPALLGSITMPSITVVCYNMAST